MIRLVGSDDPPAAAERAAVAEISAAIADGRSVARRLPRGRIAEAHEIVERGGLAGHVLLHRTA